MMKMLVIKHNILVSIISIFTFFTINKPNTTMQDQNGSTKWISKTYDIKGHWLLKTEGDKTYFALSEDFKTNSGPDLKVYLNAKSMEEIGNRESIDLEGVFMGELESEKGAQRYTIPSDVDPSKYKSIAIHCRRYSVVWGGVNIFEE